LAFCRTELREFLPHLSPRRYRGAEQIHETFHNGNSLGGRSHQEVPASTNVFVSSRYCVFGRYLYPQYSPLQAAARDTTSPSCTHHQFLPQIESISRPEFVMMWKPHSVSMNPEKQLSHSASSAAILLRFPSGSSPK